MINLNPKYLLNGPRTHLDVLGVYDPEYEECVFTYPYFKLEVTWFVPSGAPFPRWESIIRAFNFTTWCLIGISLMFGILMFWSFAILSNILKETNLDTRLSRYWMNSLQSLLAMNINYELRGAVPVIFFTLWLFYCLQIYTLYQASLIGYLLNPGELPPIKNVKELEESELKKFTMMKFDDPRNSFWRLTTDTLCVNFVQSALRD